MQAASDDLKLQMKQAEQPNKVPKKAARAAKKGPEADAEGSENEKESVPSPVAPPPYCDSQSEPEREDGDEDEEEDDDDGDVFKGKFALPAKNAEGLEAVEAKASPKVKQALQSFDREVLESLPENLSQWLGCLVAVVATYVCLCAGLQHPGN